MRNKKPDLALADSDRQELDKISRSRTESVRRVQREVAPEIRTSR